MNYDVIALLCLHNKGLKTADIKGEQNKTDKTGWTCVREISAKLQKQKEAVA